VGVWGNLESAGKRSKSVSMDWSSWGGGRDLAGVYIQSYLSSAQSRGRRKASGLGVKARLKSRTKIARFHCKPLGQGREFGDRHDTEVV